MRKIFYELTKNNIPYKTTPNFNEAQEWKEKNENADFYVRLEEMDPPISKEQQEKREERISKINECAGVG